MLIPIAIVHAIMADPELKDSGTRLNLALIVASAIHHAKKLVEGKFGTYRIVKAPTQTKYIEFPTNQTAKIYIQLPAETRLFEITINLPRPVSRTEQIVLEAIASAHNAAGEIIGSKPYLDLMDSFLEKMDDVIIDTAVAWLIEEKWSFEIDKSEIIGDVRRFIESLMTTSYEGRASEISVAITRTRNKGRSELIKIGELLESKKTSALFAGHRHLLMCNLQGEIQRYLTLSPYSDVQLMPKTGAIYLAPYEYQPVMHFSFKRKALTFLLTRNREIFVILGPEIVFIRDVRGWRILAVERFLDLLSELLWINSKKSLSKKHSNTLAIHLGMLCLSLRQRRKGGLFVIYRRGIKPKESLIQPSLAEKFYQSIFYNQLIFSVPVSIMCNAAAVDGATLLTWDGRLERFGVIVNTKNLKSTSEGARTRAAESISSKGVAIKVSEDGPITLFSKGKALITIG